MMKKFPQESLSRRQVFGYCTALQLDVVVAIRAQCGVSNDSLSLYASVCVTRLEKQPPVKEKKGATHKTNMASERA